MIGKTNVEPAPLICILVGAGADSSFLEHDATEATSMSTSPALAIRFMRSPLGFDELPRAGLPSILPRRRSRKSAIAMSWSCGSYEIVTERDPYRGNAVK